MALDTRCARWPRAGLRRRAGAFTATASTSARVVPHFEEGSLRPRALGARLPARLAGVRGDARLREVAEETLGLGAARDKPREGGFYSALRRRLRGRGGPVLRLDARGARGRARVRPPRPVRGAPDPGRRRPGRDARAAVEPRAARVRPGTDDKRRRAWNALMISALVTPGRCSERPGLPRRRARRGATSCSTSVRDAGRLQRRQSRARPKLPALLEPITPSCSRR